MTRTDLLPESTPGAEHRRQRNDGCEPRRGSPSPALRHRSATAWAPGGRPASRPRFRAPPQQIVAERTVLCRLLSFAIRVAPVVQSAAVDAISKSTDPPSSLRGTSGQELPHALQSLVARDSDHPLTGAALGWALSGPSRSEAVLRKAGDAGNSLRGERTRSRWGRPNGRDGMDGWFHPANGVETRRADCVPLGVQGRTRCSAGCCPRSSDVPGGACGRSLRLRPSQCLKWETGTGGEWMTGRTACTSRAGDARQKKPWAACPAGAREVRRRPGAHDLAFLVEGGRPDGAGAEPSLPLRRGGATRSHRLLIRGQRRRCTQMARCHGPRALPFARSPARRRSTSER